MTTAIPNGAVAVCDAWIDAIQLRYGGAARGTTHYRVSSSCSRSRFHVSSISKLPSVAALATNQFAVPLTFTPNFTFTSSGAVALTLSKTARAASTVGATASRTRPAISSGLAGRNTALG